jgi:ubiquinone biosynthesis protein UbiJ
MPISRSEALSEYRASCAIGGRVSAGPFHTWDDVAIEPYLIDEIRAQETRVRQLMQLQAASNEYLRNAAPIAKGFKEIYAHKESVQALQDQVDHLTNLVETLFSRLESVGILKSNKEYNELLEKIDQYYKEVDELKQKVEELSGSERTEDS